MRHQTTMVSQTVVQRSAKKARVDAEERYYAGDLETIAVPRAWVREHGSPDRYDALAVLAARDAADGGRLGIVRSRQQRRDVMQMGATWSGRPPIEKAWYREGPEGQAFLFVQGWDGPA